MRMLVNGNSTRFKRIVNLSPAFSQHIGVLHTPRCLMRGLNLFEGADNDAFSDWNEQRYITMLRHLVYLNTSWVSCPDKVGDAKETLRLFYRWQPVISLYRLPTAFVAQDGVEDTDIPWNSIACLFVGGSTGFKYSQAVIDVIKEAQIRKKLVHIGRVNSAERIEYFFNLNADSFDGSWYAKDHAKLMDHLNVILDLKLRRRGAI